MGEWSSELNKKNRILLCLVLLDVMPFIVQSGMEYSEQSLALIGCVQMGTTHEQCAHYQGLMFTDSSELEG